MMPYRMLCNDELFHHPSGSEGSGRSEARVGLPVADGQKTPLGLTIGLSAVYALKRRE